VSASVAATKISFPQSLLNSAANLLAKDDKLSLSMAVVLCHTACDIAADRALAEALEKRSLGHTQAPLRAMFSGYSPKNDRIWDFYCTLTGDDIKQRPFWQKVVNSSKCRDGIIHSGKFATTKQATEAHKGAVEFVKHLKQWD
jgi:ribosomal protein S12 methylthiotransferase accessory factor YcaO